MTKKRKDNFIGLRLDHEDVARLGKIMERHGRDNQADMLRWLIREEEKRTAPTPPAAPRVAVVGADEAEDLD